MKLSTIALIAAGALAVYVFVLRKGGGATLGGATSTSGGGARGIDWQAPPKLSGWQLLDPTIKGSPAQMAVGLFSSDTNIRDS
jgi:hypothetical protein